MRVTTSLYSGQKTYNGVAVISKQPMSDVVTDVPDLDDPQRRILGVTVGDVRILDLYVVNGSEVGSEKYEYKLNWLDKVTRYIEQDMAKHSHYVVLGDFNIAPEDRDVHDPEAWHEKILCSTPERDALKRIQDLGFVDSFRLFEQEDETYSWWDYRAAGFRRNRGLRIDLVLASKDLSGLCQRSWIDKEPRKLERPSDHAPAVAEFNLS
jgi:exodeoxyribonuclease-3